MKQLAAVIAERSQLSRRKATELIREGRVLVNNHKAKLGLKVNSEEVIMIDNVELPYKKLQYFKVYKPVGYVCSRNPQGNDRSIYDLLPPELHHLTYAGRLDKDSSGLVLMSNDGDWINHLTHPKHEVKRSYVVDLLKPLPPAAVQQLKKGVTLDDGLSTLGLIGEGSNWLVTIAEGRKHQVKRSFEAVDNKVVKLKRTQHGPFVLGTLRVGKFAELPKPDINR